MCYLALARQLLLCEGLREGGGISSIADFLKLRKSWSSPSFLVTALHCSLELDHITLSVIIGLLPSKGKQFVSMIRGLNINLHFPVVLRSMKLGIQVD